MIFVSALYAFVSTVGFIVEPTPGCSVSCRVTWHAGFLGCLIKGQGFPFSAVS